MRRVAAIGLITGARIVLFFQVMMPDHESNSKRRRSPRDEGSENVRSKGRRRGTSSRTGGSERSGSTSDLIRLNKYISRAGVASRRKADELIEQGRVKINGEVVTKLGTKVRGDEKVEVNGRLISPRRHDYILVNKPKDTITTTDDPHDRRTVMELIGIPEKEKRGLFPVGRLDRDTTGVLLVTNDGDLAHRLMHPSYEVDKLYRVKTKEAVKPHELDLLRKGITLDDGEAAADRAAYLRPKNHHEIGLSIHEGRNRQIRRMFEAVGNEVVYLERVNYAGLTAEGLRPGKWRRLRDDEVRRLQRQVGLT